MEYSTGKISRVITCRLSHGEAVYASIESLAVKEKIDSAVVFILGGIENAGVVVGPETPTPDPSQVLVRRFSGPGELLAIGTIFIDVNDEPKLHLHAAMGREDDIVVGCPREGAYCWLIGEVIILEIIGVSARRMVDTDSGFALLNILKNI